jgi:anti-sigma factor RsiW
MKCKQIHNDLIFYLDNELPAERRRVVEEHLVSCADCHEFFHILQSSMAQIKEEKNPEVSPFFYTRLSAKVDQTKSQVHSGWLVRFVQPAFFGVLLFAGIYAGIWFGSQAKTTERPASTENSLVATFNDFEAETIESFLVTEP